MIDSIKLTSMVKAAGCAAKLSPGTLDSVLRGLPLPSDPNVLVGFQTNDDAGVYKLSDDVAIVQTVDFFTPVVDDPFTFGQVAATNALSDIYAMGGKAISALSIVGFPDKGDPAVLREIIRGGLDKLKEADCTLIGGHSIRNDDILFGCAVTGVIHPKKIWKNVGALTNDVLLFTKALGTGVISTALKRGHASDASVQASIASMSQLNRAAAEALREVEAKIGAPCVHAVTDVTGFGLLAHTREMALGDPENGIPRVSIEIQCNAIRLLPGALEAAREGHVPGGLKNNREFLGDCVTFADAIPEENRALLFDPQTSGGLLIAISPDRAELAIATLQQRGVTATRIGRVLPKTSPLLSVI